MLRVRKVKILLALTHKHGISVLFRILQTGVGAWIPKIEQTSSLAIHPGLIVGLNYGQQGYEGIRKFRSRSNIITFSAPPTTLFP